MRFTVRSLFLVCTIFLASGLLLAQAQSNQAPRPVRQPSEEMAARWHEIQDKLVTMAQDFPEDKYDFKIQKEQRTFAQNILHVAGADYEILSGIAGKKMGPDMKDIENPSRDTYKTKADVVAFIKQVTDDGANLIKSQGDEGLNAVIKNPFGNSMMHRWSVWVEAIEHAGEHYGQLVVYYRANNLVPPESRPQPK
jgi:uncharacterized damage-inducible protein DinB